MVKSGIWNSLPYVSKSTPREFFTSVSSTDPSEDNEVAEGEADTEFADDAGLESEVIVLRRTGFWARAVVAILTVRDDFLVEQLMKDCQRCAWGTGCTEIEVEKAIVGQTLSEVCWVSVADVLGSSKNESNSNPNDRRLHDNS